VLFPVPPWLNLSLASSLARTYIPSRQGVSRASTETAGDADPVEVRAKVIVVGQPHLPAAVGIHDVDLVVAIAAAAKGDLRPIGREGGVQVRNVRIR
jgi:hypothetical protein